MGGAKGFIVDDTTYGEYPEPQVTYEQAVALFDSKELESWDAYELVAFQLFQKRLCVDFSIFHKAVEEALGRPVWTHEFARNKNLQDEFNGLKPKPTMEKIIALIPPEKLIVISTDKEGEQ